MINILLQRYNQHRHEVWQFVRYGLSGVTGAVIQVGCLYIFVDIFGLWYLHGVFVAYLIAIGIVFSLQKFWTFRDKEMSRFGHQSMLYTISAICSLGLNVLFMYILVDVFDIWHIAAQICVVGTVGVLTFLFNKFVTFQSVATAPES